MNRRMLRFCALGAAMLVACGALAEPVDLLEVDHRLYELGYRDSACNGVLDDVTIRALKNFQIANGLEATGEADAATVERLFQADARGQAEYLSDLSSEYAGMATLAEGAYGAEVVRLQQTLKALGYFSGSCDGAYGEATAAAVCRFRLANGLPESAEADGAVFMRAYGATPVAWEDFLQENCASAGDSGAMVRTLQTWLQRKGYFQGECSGRYGEGTQQAVRRFQNDMGLETSGDVDIATCRALYEDAHELILGERVIRRGDTGAAAEDVCRLLATLGYHAHARFNMQSELALMEFQLANGLEVTGTADRETLDRLRSERAVRWEERGAPQAGAAWDDAQMGRISRRALSLLGQMSELDSDFDFVKYVCLSCGVALTERSQLSARELPAGENARAGAVIGVELKDGERMGVAVSEGAMAYRAESGYIVMSYLEALHPERVRVYEMGEAQ